MAQTARTSQQGTLASRPRSFQPVPSDWPWDAHLDIVRSVSDAPWVVVDDNSLELEFLQHCYRETGLDAPLACFAEADECLDYVRRALAGEAPLPSQVLIDVTLPPRNGFELVDELKRLVPDIEGLALFTNARRDEDTRRAETLGVKLYLKPTGLEDYRQFLLELAGTTAEP